MRRVNIFLGVFFFNFQHKKIIFFSLEFFFCIFSKDLSSPSTKEPFSQKKGTILFTQRLKKWYFFFLKKETKNYFGDNFASFHFHTWLETRLDRFFLFSFCFCWDKWISVITLHAKFCFFLGGEMKIFENFLKKIFFLLFIISYSSFSWMFFIVVVVEITL